MNRETTEHEIYEEDLCEESSNKRIIIDLDKFHEIQKQDFTIEKRDAFKKSSNLSKLFKLFGKKDKTKEILVITSNEQAIDITQTAGSTCIPLINKNNIRNEIRRMNIEGNFRYVELAGTEIIIKACFKEGIDTPLQLMLLDERIKYPMDKAIIAKLEGNLLYQKVRFIIRPNYSVSLSDAHLDRSYVLYYLLQGIQMSPGAKVMSVSCRNAYIISTNHTIKMKNALQPITIDNPFNDIMRIIYEDDLNYNDMMKKQIPYIQNPAENEIIPVAKLKQKETQYRIQGIIEMKNIKVIINQDLEDNYIHIGNIKKLSEIIAINSKNTLGTTTKIITIAAQEIPLQFELTDKISECIIGQKFLRLTTPYKMGENYFEFTYQNTKFKTERLN